MVLTESELSVLPLDRKYMYSIYSFNTDFVMATVFGLLVHVYITVTESYGLTITANTGYTYNKLDYKTTVYCKNHCFLSVKAVNN